MSTRVRVNYLPLLVIMFIHSSRSFLLYVYACTCTCMCTIIHVTFRVVLPTQSPRRSNSTSSKVVSRQSSSLFRAYNQRAMRQAGAPIQRQHHWGFKSLRPMAPLNAPQLMGLKEVGGSLHCSCLYARVSVY